MAPEFVVALHVAVEVVRQCLGMQHGKVVRLAEGVHGELPVAVHLVSIAAQPLQIAEVPPAEIGCELVAEQRVGIELTAWLRMHPQQAVVLR